jgi:hypothetical protein
MRTRHCAQVPPPPQADGTNSCCSASVCSSLPPAGTEIVFSPLIVMSTLPVATRRERATRIRLTSTVTIIVNSSMPRPKVAISRCP